MATDKPDDMLRAHRNQIDELDSQLLRILAKRMEAVRAIGKYKRENGLEPLDQQRFEMIMQTQLAKAEALQLSSEFVTRLYELIHDYTLTIEAEDS